MAKLRDELTNEPQSVLASHQRAGIVSRRPPPKVSSLQRPSNLILELLILEFVRKDVLSLFHHFRESR